MVGPIRSRLLSERNITSNVPKGNPLTQKANDFGTKVVKLESGSKEGFSAKLGGARLPQTPLYFRQPPPPM